MPALSDRLREIAIYIDSLTYGEMIQFVSGVWRTKSAREIDQCSLARMLHTWAVKAMAVDFEELDNVVEAPTQFADDASNLDTSPSSASPEPAPAVRAAASAAAEVLPRLEAVPAPVAEEMAPAVAPVEPVDAPAEQRRRRQLRLGLTVQQYDLAASLSPAEFKAAFNTAVRICVDERAAKAEEAITPPAVEMLQAAE
jgi:hypothetical protein